MTVELDVISLSDIRTVGSMLMGGPRPSVPFPGGPPQGADEALTTTRTRRDHGHRPGGLRPPRRLAIQQLIDYTAPQPIYREMLDPGHRPSSHLG